MPLRRLRIRPRTDLLLQPTGEGVTAQDGTARAYAPSAADPNRPTDVAWSTLVTMPMTSDTALFTGGLTRMVGTAGVDFGTAAGGSYSVNDGNTTLTPGAGPVDPGGRILWNRVRSAGEAQGRTIVWEPIGRPNNVAKALFFDWTYQLAADWQGHASNQHKMLWYGFNENGQVGYNQGILAAWGSGQGNVGFAPYFQGPLPATRFQGIASPRGTLTRGVWHRMQALMVCESSIGAQDGYVKWWLNGTLIGNIDFWFNATTLGYPVVSPYWGGQGGSAPHALYVFMDYLKVSYSTSRPVR